MGFCSVETGLAAATSVPDETLVVVDGFCRAYLSAGEDRRDVLADLLTREAGVCLVTRPRSLDWLFEFDAALSAATVLDEWIDELFVV